MLLVTKAISKAQPNDFTTAIYVLSGYNCKVEFEKEISNLLEIKQAVLADSWKYNYYSKNEDIA